LPNSEARLEIEFAAIIEEFYDKLKEDQNSLAAAVKSYC